MRVTRSKIMKFHVYILLLALSSSCALQSMERESKKSKTQENLDHFDPFNDLVVEDANFEIGPLLEADIGLFEDQELGAAQDAQFSLIKAVKSNNSARILALLQQDVPVNEVDTEGNSALHWAVVNQNIPLIKLLVAHEADPFLKNYDGKRPIDLAPKTDVYGVALLVTPKNSELALLLKAYYYNAFEYYLDKMVTFKLL